MTTGVRAFPGDSALSTLSSILRDDVRPLIDAAPEAPPQLDLVIQRCLRKNPDERWQTMKDVQMALAALKHESDSGMLYRARLADIPSPSSVQNKAPESTTTMTGPALSEIQSKISGEKKSSPGLMIGAIAGVVILAGAAAGGYWWTHRKPVEPPAPVVQAPPPTPVAAVTPEPAPAPPPENILTNDSVIDMVKEKVPVSLVLNQIRSEKTNFVLNSPEIIRMTKAGVPEKVIEGMRDPKKIPDQAVTPPPIPAVAQPKQVAIAPKQPPTVTTPAVPAIPTASQPQPAPVTTPQPPPVTAVVTPAVARSMVVVPDGSPFSISLVSDITAATEAGSPVSFIVSKDFKIGEVLVVAKGTSVTGAVVEPNGKKFLGMGSKMTMRIDQTETTGGQKSTCARLLPGGQRAQPDLWTPVRSPSLRTWWPRRARNTSPISMASRK